jgi:uroporphyrinogen-III synthase
MADFTIATLEARFSDEMAALIARHGGQPLPAPAVREEPDVDLAALGALLDAMEQGQVQVLLFQTGVGARALFAAAERLGRLDTLRAGLAAALVVVRGPKPLAALRQAGARVDVQTPAPYTTDQVLAALAGVDLAGKRVVVTRYGAPNPTLLDALRARGADPWELALYRWVLPDDREPLHRLIAALAAGQVDAVLFTSQVQVQHLFQVASERGQASALAEALRTRTCVGSVGPVVTRCLAQYGIAPHVEPQSPKMAPLVTAVLAHLRGAQGLAASA